MIMLGATQGRRFEVHGFVPGRGFVARFYAATDSTDAVRTFKRDFPKGQVFWTALAPESATQLGCCCELEGVALGLHTAEDREAAIEMAREAHREGLEWLGRGKLKSATEKLGFLQGISALANREGEGDLVQALDPLLMDLGQKLSQAWKAA